MELSTYLFFNGQCADAFKFYERCLGGKAETITYGSSPSEADLPADWQDKIMHARLTVGEEALMGSDAPPGHYQKPQGFSVSVSVRDVTDGERIFKDLSEGGQVQMPFAPTFWAAGFGMCVDRFGIAWMVNCEQGDK
jgi:PhnB protein